MSEKEKERESEAITSLRNELDGIDCEMAALFKRRMDISLAIADETSRAGLPVGNPERERATIFRAAELAGDDLVRDTKMVFTTLFGLAKARQRARIKGEGPLVQSITRAAAESRPIPSRTLVACQGTEGSYAQQATTRMFEAPSIVFMRDFESVFEIVEKGLCPYGILPVENSSAGSVAQVYDLMVKHRFHIVRSVRVKVDHVLLGRRGAKLSDIREVASHPHALAQCGAFLKANPDIKAVPATNTAVAAKELAEGDSPARGVIASRACADIYGLDILAENVSDASYNYTRFICISRKLEITPDADKFSIMLTLPHRPGSLCTIISKFAAAGVNLTKLESRPIPGMDFEFRFTFEFESSPTDPNVLALLAELSQDPEIESFAFLGAYA